MPDRLATAGASTHILGPARGPRARHPDIARVLEPLIEQADIVHIHALWEEIQHHAARLARRAGRPYIIRPCGMLDPWPMAQGWWKKRAYLMLRMQRHLDHAAAIHFTTEIERDASGRTVRLSAPSIVEPNGIDFREFEPLPPRGGLRRAHRVLGERPVVLFMGRIHSKKGLDLLVPAFARVAREDAVLVLAGPDDGGYVAQVRRMIEQNGLGGRVIETGMLRGKERVEALVDADLFVLPSYQENFGVAVVEALAAGVPVIVSDQVALHRRITAERVGEVVPTAIEPLAAALDRWLGDDALRRAAAARARPFVREAFDWNGIAARWAGHYERLIQA
jgi:glycosyltransferase involved in cell wall biosynthesis